MVELLKIKDVSRITGMSRSMIYREISAGRFPPSIKLAERCSRWPSTVIEEWVQEKIDGGKAA